MSTSIIVAFITGVLGPVTILYIKNKLEKKSEKPDMIKDALKMSELVNNKIDDIRDELKADRVWIAQFHNGGHFYPTGKSMAKFSVIYEVVQGSVSSIQSNFQSIPVNLFSKSINHLLEDNIIEISDFKDETIATYGLKYIAEESGCKSAYILAIKSIDEKFIGILGIDFTKRKVKLDEKHITKLKVNATSIGGVLMEGLQH